VKVSPGRERGFPFYGGSSGNIISSFVKKGGREGSTERAGYPLGVFVTGGGKVAFAIKGDQMGEPGWRNHWGAFTKGAAVQG